ncbi:hypothetical protein DB347_19350 [Opitutaceae bacterium EW11]|nr:hypothetical protein DB347_19350 [Opitutaceae bacterium EW11]
MLSRLRLAPWIISSAIALSAAEPLSKSFPLDFYRDVPSRSLRGLATRSDGRLVAGPTLTDLGGPALPELLWCIEPAGSGKWLVGTGPEGRVIEIALDTAGTGYTVRDVAKVDEPQVLALKRLPDGSILAGTSPNGVLALVRDGKVAARVPLPVDSVFDIVLQGDRAFVATGNPARIYAVDLAKFSSAGLVKERVRQTAALSEKGISLFGEVRDRNVRRLAWLGKRLVAGSSPKGNIYAFDAAGAPPELLQENRDAEVAALLPQPNGDLYAALVFAATQGENRINRPATPPPSGAPETPANPATAPLPPERFNGRSAVVFLPKDGFPETVVARANLAFYALAKHGDTLVIGGGEQGDVLGYDIPARQSLSFAGSDSAQVNALVPIPPTTGGGATDRFLALRNNAPGLALIDFAGSGSRSAETRRLDLGTPGRLGALRIGRLAEISPDQLKIELRGNLGSDEIEGWTPWTATERRADGWMAPDMKARNVKVRLEISGPRSQGAELDDAVLHFLPQNRRPQLSEFRVIAPNYALIPPPEPNPPVVTTLSQLVSTQERDERKKPSLMSSQVVPEPGMQVVTWNVTDPDGDSVACTFSIRRAGSTDWTDLAVNSTDGYAQFATSNLEDGVYATRLIADEQAPRPAADRLSVIFETPDIVIDNTPPTIAEFKVTREAGAVKVKVSGRDGLSLLEGADFVFNNGHREAVTQPVDGIRDSQTESFAAEIPADRLTGATSVEVNLYDSVGNRSSKRAVVPPLH